MEKIMNSQGTGTVIGAQTHVKGNLQGDEDLNVIGRVDGTISLTRTLIVEPAGMVQADVKVLRAIISGTVVGNISADEIVHITEEGRVVGDISAPRVILVEGASFRGNIDMGDLEAPRSAAAATARPRTSLAPSRPAPAKVEAPRPAPPRPAPPPRRVVAAEARPARPAPRPSGSEGRDAARDAERTVDLRERRPESLERRAEAAAQAVAARPAPAPRPTAPRSVDELTSSAPPRPPTTAGKKAKARRR